MHNFGAGDILEVKLDARRNTVMLPFSETVVPAVDLDAGRVTVELPEGTFNDDLPPDLPSLRAKRSNPGAAR